jgi:NTE family protein
MQRELREGGGDSAFAPDAQLHVINVNLRDLRDRDIRQMLLRVPTAFTISTAKSRG